MQKPLKILWNKPNFTHSFTMLTRIIGFIIIITTVFVLLIFITPDFTDQIWNKEFNANIRNIKNKSLQFTSGSDSASSLFDKIKNSSKSYFDNTKKSIQEMQNTVDTKVTQVNEAATAVEKAYTWVLDAADKIQKLTGTGK